MKEPRWQITPINVDQKCIRKDFNQFVPSDSALQNAFLQSSSVNQNQDESRKQTESLLTDDVFENVVYANQDSNDGTIVIQSISQPSPNDTGANQAVIIESLANIVVTLAQLKTGLDFLNTKVEKIESLLEFRDNVSLITTDENFKPVDSKETLDALEASLDNEKVMANYISFNRPGNDTAIFDAVLLDGNVQRSYTIGTYRISGVSNESSFYALH
ncbi:uncharacterized protein LOC129725659 [Wyeomyia smithii]|uniref:uncharacterized protein LOC129725659 n=1 Tax=Wyeomyia smithii TaxID=174621 RepID=UPI002467F483|nr:uncharacterized protein LOC129725659 [Wyeomyia smithii]